MKLRFTDRRAMAVLFIFISASMMARGLALRWTGEAERPLVPDSELDFKLTEESRSRGLDFVHRTFEADGIINVRPWVESFGASVAVADVNGDGHMDIFLPRNRIGEQNALFLNNGRGHFQESAERLGLARINVADVSIRPLFMDCDSDGRLDLFLTSSHCPRVFRQGLDGAFTEVLQTFSVESCYAAQAASVLDMDEDGHLDVILGGINGDGGAFRTLPDNFVDARNGSRLEVLRNDGQCRFTEEIGKIDPQGHFFYHSVGVGDLRGAGKPDIWIAADFNSDKVFLREPDGRYQLMTMEKTNSRFGMNSEVFYLDGQENPFVFVSHSYKLGYLVGGNALWRHDGRTFVDHALKKGLRKCGWAWGARAVDLNNDGHLDLAVANGFISGDRRKDYWYSFSVMSTTSQGVVSQSRFWPEMAGRNFSGYERDCLFLNLGDRFVDVAPLVGFDDEMLDGRAVAVIDSDNSGVQDIVVANQKGRLYYYRNSLREPRNWIGFDLRLKKGGRAAVGAMVTVHAGGRVHRREAYTTNSYAAQSDSRLHFGLGDAAVDRVEVIWPNGKRSSLGPLAVNRYHQIWETE